MDTADQWPQEVAPPGDQYSSRAVGDQKKVKPPQKDQAPLNCPRCQSTNTKFCYYNNYSLTQPRYFCKNCRRYWTAGGSLRNVPVGGGSRKNKRSSNSLVSTKNTSDNHFSQFSFQNPNSYNKHHDHNQDLNLAFPTAATQDYSSLDASRFLQVPSKIEVNKDNNINNIQLNLNSSYSSSHSTSTSLSAMELLKINSTNFSSRGSHTFMSSAPTQNPNMIMYAQGFQFQDFSKPQAEVFAVDEHGSKYESGVRGNRNNQEHINGAADQRLMFPYGATSSSKHIQTTNGSEQNKVDGMYWNGMSGGGSW